MLQDPLHLLCVEPRFPGRLGTIADWLVRYRGFKVTFLSHQVADAPFWPASAGRGLSLIHYQVGGIARENTVHWTCHLERGLCHAYAVWETLEAHRPRPIDVVLGHSGGLGSTLFIPAHQARTPILQLHTYFLHPRRNDLADELAPLLPADYAHWRVAANAMDLLELENGGVPWTHSNWQRSLFPPAYQPDFRVSHPGVSIPPAAGLISGARRIGDRVISDSTFVLTFAASDLDRVRGFDRFVRLAAGLQREGVDVLAVAAGSRSVRKPYDIENFGRDLASDLLATNPGLDRDRLVLLGEVGHAEIERLVVIGDLHVDPSRPYPIAHPLLVAMTHGRSILAWNSEAVNEILTHERNALVASDDEQALAMALHVARDPAEFRPLGLAAIEVARRRFDRDQNLPIIAAWLESLATGPGLSIA